jgi:hypothetical protein
MYVRLACAGLLTTAALLAGTGCCGHKMGCRPAPAVSAAPPACCPAPAPPPVAVPAAPVPVAPTTTGFSTAPPYFSNQLK